jgi:Fic family protein
VGRLFVTLQLCEAGVLHEPLLYLSLYLKQHRSTYYELLSRVRENGDWEEWLRFFLEGVRQTAEEAVATAQRLGKIFLRHRNQIETTGRRAGSAIRVHDASRRGRFSRWRKLGGSRDFHFQPWHRLWTCSWTLESSRN